MLEESFECLNKAQCAAYLEKLKLEVPEECTVDFLDLLIGRHLQIIPFENLDLVQTHELVVTELESVYEKVVFRGRGGYCFELNALFLGLLRGLGYHAYPVACRVLRRPGLRMPTHRASVVCLGGKKYFCDVGYGGIACTRAAQMDVGAVTEMEFGSFTFEREYDGWLNLCYTPKKGDNPERMKIFMVAEIPSAPIDFAAANQAMCEEGSMFYDKVIVQKMTPYGPVSIDGERFTLRGENGKKVFEISSRQELLRILREEFQIEIS